MKDDFVYSSSSIFTSIPAILILGVAGVLCAFFHKMNSACLFLLFFLITLLSRVLTRAAIRNISVRLIPPAEGIFAGEKVKTEIRVRNQGFLPAAGLELFFPLSPSLCLIPENSFVPEGNEASELKEAGFSDQKAGRCELNSLLWYEDSRVFPQWESCRRGIYRLSGWELRAGDLFGLTKGRKPLENTKDTVIAVYPALCEVSPELFFRNLWNSDTGARGTEEDVTVLRSMREYMSFDSARNINWRKTAMGLPLSVNLYDRILPQKIHFLFDGESFAGQELHREEMEEALSILASELVILGRERASFGLSLPKGAGNRAGNYSGENLQNLLYHISEYEMLSEKRTEEGEILLQDTVFSPENFLEIARDAGQFYYIAYSYDTSLLYRNNGKSRWLREILLPENTMLLFMKETGKEEMPYPALRLTGLKKSGSRENRSYG